MNRKISFLAAGLLLAATMTGCTQTAAPYVTPYGRLPRTAAGDYRANQIERSAVDGYAYRRNIVPGVTGINGATAGTYALPRAATGRVGADGRWNTFSGANAGAVAGNGAPIANYPAPGTMYR